MYKDNNYMKISKNLNHPNATGVIIIKNGIRYAVIKKEEENGSIKRS